MKNVLSKLSLARVYIKSHPLKKDGRNEFSKYDYFTPEIVSKLVNDACIEGNIICVFSLKQDQLGYFGEIVTTDLETGEQITTEMRTEKPMITATNATQQMGGMNTYTKRYAFMSLFDIEDNTIDFDSQDNSKQSKSQQPQNTTSTAGSEKPWLNKVDKAGKVTETWTKVINSLKGGGYTIAQVEGKYKINKELKAELLAVK